MNRETQELKNRKRCLACKYYGCNVCPRLADADTFQIDKCIIDYDTIKLIAPGSLDEFIFERNPKEYLSFLGYKEKENYPKVGQLCITLKSGFSSTHSGKFVRVIKEDDIQIFLEDAFSNKPRQYCVEKRNWYELLFKAEED